MSNGTLVGYHVNHSQFQHAILQAKTNACAGSSHHWGNLNKRPPQVQKIYKYFNSKKRKRSPWVEECAFLGQFVNLGWKLRVLGPISWFHCFCIFTKPFPLLFHIVDWGPRWFYTSLLKTSNHNRILCRVFMLLLIQIRTYCIHACKHFNQEGFNLR